MAEPPEVQIPEDAGPYRGRISLTLAGFASQETVTIEQVVRAIEILPDHHLEDLESVQFDPGRHLARAYSRLLRQPIRRNAHGQYIDDLGCIAIYRIDTPEAFYRTLYHEIGHCVFARVLSGVERKRWVTGLYPAEPPAPHRPLDTASEDFAAAYAAFVLDPRSLRDLPDKQAFLRDTVFLGFVPDRAALSEA